jgi:hypothetical protein
MNYVESLLQADRSRADEKRTKKMKSTKLAYILGQTEPVEITIQQLDQRKANEIVAMQYTKRGDFDMQRAYDAKLRLVAEAVIEPPLKNEEVRSHFGAASPTELAEKLFGYEVSKIAMQISRLTGIDLNEADEAEAEQEIKN